MAVNRVAKVMEAQLKKATREPNEYVKFYMNDENVSEWFILISNFDGDNGEFAGGEYLLKMVAPEGFPFKPPEFYFYTENGVYGTNTKVCISIGEYHSDQYRAALGMDGFANQLWNGMIGWKSLGGGISILHTDIKEKKRLAARSRDYNRKNYPDLIAKIESSFENYSQKWDRKKIPLPTQIRIGMITKEEANALEAATANYCALSPAMSGLSLK